MAVVKIKKIELGVFGNGHRTDFKKFKKRRNKSFGG